MKKVSNSNTKVQILKAYAELVEALKEERSQKTALQNEIKKKAQLLEKVKEQTSEGGTSETIQALRGALNKHLDKLEHSILEEEAKFRELKEAIEVEKGMLEELYKVKAEAESLEALILTNRQSKEKLEEELAERKAALEKEITNTKEEWKREQEEYEYNLKIKRRNEEDAYQQKKQKQEKELKEQKIEFEKSISDRENAVKEKEEELERLRKEVDSFDQVIAQKIKETREAVTDQMQKEFDYKQKLDVKDLESEISLHKQTIESLKVKVEEQQNYINSLSNRTEFATQQVKDIAMKAIENSGTRTFTIPSSDKPKEDN